MYLKKQNIQSMSKLFHPPSILAGFQCFKATGNLTVLAWIRGREGCKIPMPFNVSKDCGAWSQQVFYRKLSKAKCLACFLRDLSPSPTSNPPNAEKHLTLAFDTENQERGHLIIWPFWPLLSPAVSFYHVVCGFPHWMKEPHGLYLSYLEKPTKGYYFR